MYLHHSWAAIPARCWCTKGDCQNTNCRVVAPGCLIQLMAFSLDSYIVAGAFPTTRFIVTWTVLQHYPGSLGSALLCIIYDFYYVCVCECAWIRCATSAILLL